MKFFYSLSRIVNVVDHEDYIRVCLTIYYIDPILLIWLKNDISKFVVDIREKMRIHGATYQPKPVKKLFDLETQISTRKKIEIVKNVLISEWLIKFKHKNKRKQ